MNRLIERTLLCEPVMRTLSACNGFQILIFYSWTVGTLHSRHQFIDIFVYRLYKYIKAYLWAQFNQWTLIYFICVCCLIRQSACRCFDVILFCFGRRMTATHELSKVYTEPIERRNWRKKFWVSHCTTACGGHTFVHDVFGKFTFGHRRDRHVIAWQERYDVQAQLLMVLQTPGGALSVKAIPAYMAHATLMPRRGRTACAGHTHRRLVGEMMHWHIHEITFFCCFLFSYRMRTNIGL
jgi:hypothetical protein